MSEAVIEIRQKVDEAKSSLSSNRSRGRVLDALMQQKRHGKISGIYGRLVKLLLPNRAVTCTNYSSFTIELLELSYYKLISCHMQNQRQIIFVKFSIRMEILKKWS